MVESQFSNPTVCGEGPSANYFTSKMIGYGSFGEVYEAQISGTDEIAAIKKVYQDRRYKNRELAIMKQLRHPNIVELKDFFFQTNDKEEVFLNLVMDYMPENMYRLSKRFIKKKLKMPVISVKLYTYQLLRALAHLHGTGVCHRDIKPQNLLVDPHTHLLKLCDFGSAKVLSSGECNVSYICSRYYRAPELIFGATQYTTAIDVWSVACITAELLYEAPLFPGDSGIDQLIEIMKLLGTPTKQQLLDMNPHYQEYKFPHVLARSLQEALGHCADHEVLDFLSQLLQYSPQERPAALECLQHPVFDELRALNASLPDGVPVPQLFNWTAEERKSVARTTIEDLTPAWYCDK